MKEPQQKKTNKVIGKPKIDNSNNETPQGKKKPKLDLTPKKADNNNIDINVYIPGQMLKIKAAFVSKHLDEGMSKEDALAKWEQHREVLIEGLSHAEKVKRRFIKSTTSPQQPETKKKKKEEA